MKNKNIDLKQLKNSPYASAAGLVFVMLFVVAVIVYFVIGIFQTKDDIVLTRNSYQSNLKEIAALEELRAQSEKAEAQLAAYKDILPDDLGDVYILQEEVVKTCREFGLEVSAIEAAQTSAETEETSFIFNVSGTFENLHSYMAYISSLKQMHRFDSVTIIKNSTDTYDATLSLAILSQNGADGIVGAVGSESTES